MTPRCIEPARGPLHAELQAVPSKSVTHRALVAAAMADGTSTIRNPLDAGDTRRTLDALRALGIAVVERDGAWAVSGRGGAVTGGAAIDLGASGTTARLLTAIAALGDCPSRLDGEPRLRERPMDELVEALVSLGAVIERLGAGSFPLRAGGAAVVGGCVTISGARSSQFASALLLAAPAFARGLTLAIAPPRVSFGYVRLTVGVLEAFGAVIEPAEEGAFHVPAQRLRPADFSVEGDHSSASYALAAAAVRGGRVAVRGLDGGSTQPDARFLGDLASLGCRVETDAHTVRVEGSGRIPPFVWDLSDAPDLAPTAAVLALFADGPCVLTGLAHLAHKESDRTIVLRDNLEKLGAVATAAPGRLSITPPGKSMRHGAPVTVAGDHRMAMAFAVAGLAIPGIVIDDPGTVAKSYPEFWSDLDRLVRTGS
jgi:3-phosphoshikimate 1-carboxyvinyltransferase